MCDAVSVLMGVRVSRPSVRQTFCAAAAFLLLGPRRWPFSWSRFSDVGQVFPPTLLLLLPVPSFGEAGTMEWFPGAAPAGLAGSPSTPGVPSARVPGCSGPCLPRGSVPVLQVTFWGAFYGLDVRSPQNSCVAALTPV